MMTAILPETDIPIKTLGEPTDGSGAIVIRFGLNGTCSVQILAGESDEQETLRERFTAAQPALEMVHQLWTGEPIKCLNGAAR